MAGLTLEQFWAHTPYELQLVFAGHDLAFERSQHLLAWHAANVMSVWTKRPVHPKKLLPRKVGVVDIGAFDSREDFEAYARRKREERVN